MKVAIYSRKSVYTGKGESIANQIESCKDYIRNHSNIFQIEDQEKDFYIFEDEGFSGKNFNRPQFKEMMKLVREGKIQCIICYRLDRISRSVGDFAPLIEELNKLDVAFISVSENFDTSSPLGRAMMFIASVFAQLERETIAERIRDNYYRLAQTGRWLGGHPPLGYLSQNVVYETIDDKKKSCSYLVINSQEVEVVKLIFQKYIEFRSIKKVAEYLHDKQLKSRQGNGFTSAAIRDILLNPVYCQADMDIYQYLKEMGTIICMDEDKFTGEYGMISNYRRDYTKKSASRLPIEKWMVSVGKHVGILSGKQWILVLNYLNMNKKKTIRTAANRNEYALFSGKIICKKCGNKMFAKKSSYEDFFYYICGGKRSEAEITRGVRCDSENLPGKEVDQFLLERLLQYADSIEDWQQVVDKLATEQETDETKGERERLEQEILKKKEEFQQYTNRLLGMNLNQALVQEINRRTENLDKEIKELEQKLQLLLPDDQNAYKGIDVDRDLFLATLRYLSDNVESMTMEQKREIIDLLVDRIEWDGEKLNIFLYGQC